MTSAAATELMLRYLEGTADAAEVAQLQAALKASPELVASCAEISLQHHQLRELAEDPAAKRSLQKSTARKTLGLRPAWWAAAAVLVGLLSVYFLRPKFNTGISAEIVRVNAVQSISLEGSWNLGERIQLGVVNLTAGSAQLKLENGALVTLAGPLAAEFISPLRLRLHRGQVTTDVSNGGKGFVVESHGTEIVDLGTQFGVTANEQGETGVVVFEGEVELHKSATPNAKPYMNLNGGEGVSLDATREHATRIQAIYGQEDQSGWSLDASSAPGTLIHSISDNIVLPDFQGYYQLVPGGMKVGALPYGLSGPSWGEPFPAELTGADLITTFQDKRFNPEFQMTFSVNLPATIYVMHDNRQPPPIWLQQDFTLTPTKLTLLVAEEILSKAVAQSLPKDAQGRLFLTFSVWQREVPAGEVTLGESLDSSEKIPHFMYGLAVKRR